MTSFNATDFNFILLDGFSFPGRVRVHELANHPRIDGKPDPLRLNVYLSCDGAFVTVWYGLLERDRAMAALSGVDIPPDLDLDAAYGENLFRGYIESAEDAQVILRSLRVSARAPSRLRGNNRAELCCDPLSP